MGQGDQPPGGLYNLNAGPCVRLLPLDALVLVGVQIAVKGLAGGLDVPPPDHDLCEMGACNNVASGQLLHLRQGDVHALFPQKVDHAVLPLVPALFELRT